MNTYHTKREIDRLRVRNSLYDVTGAFAPLGAGILTGLLNIVGFAVAAWLFFALFFGIGV